jgi:hypothetical protein
MLVMMLRNTSVHAAPAYRATVLAGAGVLPADVIGAGTESEGQKAGDLAYMLAHFE